MVTRPPRDELLNRATSPVRPAQSGAAACVQPADRGLLVPYLLGCCDDGEATTFEAHLLACEPCFQDLKCLDRAGVLIREFTGSNPDSLSRLRTSLLRSRA